MNYLKPVIIASVLARALDVHSTCSALAKGGYEEVNPFLPSNCKAQIVVQSSMAVSESVLLYKLHKTHPKVAVFIGIGLTSLELSVAYHNYRVMNGVNR